MDYFPAFLDLHNKPCLIVGGGEVAARKARLLLDAGARLTVASPVVGDTISGLITSGHIRHLRRDFDPGDVVGQWLVVAATDNPTVQQEVFVAAETAGVFCNSVDDIANCSFITPAIVDRSPLVVAISSGGAAPVLARRIRAQIESLLSASTGRLAALARSWRERVMRRITDGLERRRFWEWFFAGPVADAVHANRLDSANALLHDTLNADTHFAATPGMVWLVGAGPGDPGLLTLRALQVLHSADVIVHDRLVSDDVLKLARRDAERIPVGKTPGCRENSQEAINTLLTDLAAAGKRVCRLKGGDPFIFGRGGEEAAVLAQAGIRCEVVPGITAAAGCAAAAGIPLTHRDLSQSVVLVTAHGKDSVDRLDWASLARDRQTLAVYMGVRRFPELTRELVAHGRPPDTPIAIVENGTTQRQRVIRGRLGQLAMLAAAHGVASPAMLFIGDVASLELAGEAPSVTPFPRESAIPKVAGIQ